METAVLDVTQEQAQEALKLYKQHINTPGSVDWEIERIYRAIAKGGKVIQALESIKQAGFDTRGRPVLAIVQADAEMCQCEVSREGIRFWDARKRERYDHRQGRFVTHGQIHVPARYTLDARITARARVPLIPVHHRPKAALDNYHILWEADWEDVPVDPVLLRRIGKGDAWLVLAAWDLTPVERAVLRSREVRQ